MLKVDTSEGEQLLDGLYKDQVPFAASLALNNTARDAQRAIQAHVAGTFLLRRAEFILKETAKIPKFSNKNDNPLTVEVLASERADFMHKFELGTTKEPRGRVLAIPIEARPSRAEVIPRQLRPRQLQLRRFATTGAKDQIKGKLGTFVIPGLGILQRLRKGAVRGTRLLYLFRPRARTPATLQFKEIGERTVRARWLENWAQAFARAIRSAK